MKTLSFDSQIFCHANSKFILIEELCGIVNTHKNVLNNIQITIQINRKIN